MRPPNAFAFGRRKVVGAAVGSGLSAAAAEEGGADFICVLSAGYFRAQGCGSMSALLPFSNANELTWRIATQNVLPRLKKTPVIVGLSAQDPSAHLELRLQQVKDSGFAGIINFPSVALLEGNYRAALEEAGLGYALEIKMLKRARELGLSTIGFAMSSAEALEVTSADVDYLCLSLGASEWRNLDSPSHQVAIDKIIHGINQVLANLAANRKKPKTIVFGGPVVLPQDTSQIYERTTVSGYIGGSSIERFPTATIISQTVNDFKQSALNHPQPERMGAMIGGSSVMQDLFENLRRIAFSEATVLLIGESGTGKELAAREIHRLSQRSGRELVSWNCGATTESLAMSELFGHERGAFTGALNTRVGKFETGDGGTLFMDEVTDLPLSVQASLLRVIQEREVIRDGSERRIPVNVRLIAASNKEFGGMIRDGKFRLDLFYRLNAIVLRIPSLRERVEDIPLLIRELSQELAQKYHASLPRISKPAMEILRAHPWPGNVRELRNFLERCFVLRHGRELLPSNIQELLMPEPGLVSASSGSSLVKRNSQERKRVLEEVLERHQGNISSAARELGVTRKTVYNWMSAKS